MNKQYITEINTPHIEKFLKQIYQDSWEEWFGDFILELDRLGFDLTHFPHDDYTNKVSNPHEIRIARTIALELTRLNDKIKELESKIK